MFVEVAGEKLVEGGGAWGLFASLPHTNRVYNSETVKAVILAFCSIYASISLETFAPNLISLSRLSLQILGRTQTGVFPISCQSLTCEI